MDIPDRGLINFGKIIYHYFYDFILSQNVHETSDNGW